MTAILRAERISVHYGGVRAVEDVDLQIEEGQLVGLIGPNGAGKTSFIDAITGFSRGDAVAWSSRVSDISACLRSGVRATASRARGRRRSCSTISRCARTSTSPPAVPRWVRPSRRSSPAVPAVTRVVDRHARVTRFGRRRRRDSRSTSARVSASWSASPARWPRARGPSASTSPRPVSTTPRARSSAGDLRDIVEPRDGDAARRPRHGAGAERLRLRRRARLRPGDRRRLARTRCGAIRGWWRRTWARRPGAVTGSELARTEAP